MFKHNCFFSFVRRGALGLHVWPFIFVYKLTRLKIYCCVFGLYCGHLLLCILGCTVVIYYCVFWVVMWPFIVVYSLGCTVAIYCCVFWVVLWSFIFLYLGCIMAIFLCILLLLWPFIYLYWVPHLHIYLCVLGGTFEHLFLCIGLHVCTFIYVYWLHVGPHIYADNIIKLK